MKNKAGKLIVLAIIFISLWQVFTSVVNAQTPTPPTRESLTQEIKLRAQKDVELSAAPLSPSDLAVLFSEQALTVGMTMSEVKAIYDEAYKAAMPARSPWDDLLKPQGGLIFVIVGIVLTILAGIAKDYLTVFFKKIAEGAYQKLARYRPFWIFALRKYRQSLESTYSGLKVPFRAGRPLQMKDVYVPVRVKGGSKQQVEAYKTIQDHKRLVILGDPGSGKTMLLRHITFTYARQGLYDFPEHPIPVYLELNRVESAGNSLIGALTKSLENHNFPGADGFIKSQLEKKSLLLLLDGLDEVNVSARPALVDQINDLYQKYPDNRIVVTCRIAVYQGELDNWVDQKLEIIEFSDQQLQRFMISWQKDMPPEKSIEHFFRTLQERPQIMTLARNPLLLTMVAYLYTDTEFALPHSRSEFYSRSTDLLLDQWKLERNRYKASHKRTVLQKLALFNQSQVEKTGERRTLELADVLREIRAVLPDLTLKTEDAQPLLDEIVQRSGLMLTIDGGTRYQFTHLTLQEYFAARALEAEQSKLLDFYSATPDAWREVVRLWCALEHDSTAMLKELYGLDPIIAFECLSDAQQVDNVYADELIERFKPRLHEALENDSLASAFALLAADPRPRGRKWFDFIKGNLNDVNNRLVASIVLARTNIPQAAEPLVKIATSEPVVIPFLVQLGNLAVPALNESAQRGEIWAMDALVGIGTPHAALVLLPLLWTNELKAYHAAWRLAALLSISGVEEMLSTAVLAREQHRTNQIEWAWEPFSNNINLQAITGRVAYLLHTTPEKSMLPPKELSCDSRLIILLCAVNENIYLSLDKDTRKKLREEIEDELRYLSPDEEKQKHITSEFEAQISQNFVLKHLYSRLPVAKQFDLLSRLVFAKDSLSDEDWRNYDKSIIYNFSKGWHIKVLKLLLFFPVLANLWKIYNQIVQSTVLFTWDNVILGFFGIVLLIGVVWMQKEGNWESRDGKEEISLDFRLGMELLFLTSIFGAGGACGAIVGDITHNSFTGAFVGALFGALSGILGDFIAGVVFRNMLIRRFSLWRILIIALVSIIAGALSGALSGLMGNALYGVGISASILIIISLFSLLFSLSIKKWKIGVRLMSSPNGRRIVFAFIGSALGLFLNLLIMSYPFRLIYDLGNLPIAIVFWVVWLGCFFFLFFMGEYYERRAQNPLRGLLEPSSAPIVWRHSSSLLSKWLLFW